MKTISCWRRYTQFRYSYLKKAYRYHFLKQNLITCNYGGAPETIGKDEIRKRFIVQWVWPNSTTLLSTVKIHNANRLVVPKTRIYRNEGQGGQHAEILFLSQLRKDKTHATKIEANLVQNYSPCRNCADALIHFKREIEEENKEFSVSIKFANVYYQGQGLKKLFENGERELTLLQGEEHWNEFLNDTTLVSLTNDERDELFKEAMSEKRQDNERIGAEKIKNIKVSKKQ